MSLAEAKRVGRHILRVTPVNKQCFLTLYFYLEICWYYSQNYTYNVCQLFYLISFLSSNSVFYWDKEKLTFISKASKGELRELLRASPALLFKRLENYAEKLLITAVRVTRCCVFLPNLADFDTRSVEKISVWRAILEEFSPRRAGSQKKVWLHCVIQLQMEMEWNFFFITYWLFNIFILWLILPSMFVNK